MQQVRKADRLESMVKRSEVRRRIVGCRTIVAADTAPDCRRNVMVFVEDTGVDSQIMVHLD